MSRQAMLSWCLVACSGIAYGVEDVPRAAGKVIYLDQGWSADERIQFYYTSQGSQLIPYDWFLALEQPDGFRTSPLRQEYGTASIHSPRERLAVAIPTHSPLALSKTESLAPPTTL